MICISFQATFETTHKITFLFTLCFHLALLPKCGFSLHIYSVNTWFPVHFRTDFNISVITFKVHFVSSFESVVVVY